jgi:arylsulfatase A
MTGIGNKRNYSHFGHLDPSQKTFGNLFKSAGHATCITGKWQLSNDYEGPAHFGFDEYCLWQLNRRPGRYKNPGLEINGKQLDYAKNEYGPDLVSNYALDFITRHKSGPFLLYYPMVLTHDPYPPTPDSPDWDPGAKGESVNRAPAHFADMVAYMDKLIGKLVARLDELGLRQNTLLIFCSESTSPGRCSMRARSATSARCIESLRPYARTSAAVCSGRLWYPFISPAP